MDECECITWAMRWVEDFDADGELELILLRRMYQDLEARARIADGSVLVERRVKR